MTYSLETIVSRAKRRAFAYPGSEIYGGLANARDLGPYGVQLRRNIMDTRWRCFVQERDDMVGLDASILMNSRVREASGHIANFSDPLVDCKKCKARERADKLIENYIEKHQISLTDVHVEFGVKSLAVESRTFEQQTAFLSVFKVKCPECGSSDWTQPKKFNLMFKTQQGVIDGEGKDIYLRPETAQGIFVNFKNILDTTRVRIPFGVAQIGKSFRNEITPGNFMFRVREFEQMEIEYFIPDDVEIGLKMLKSRKEMSEKWRTEQIGIKKDRLRFREHDASELSFYSKGTVDVEYEFPRGRGELQGIAYRTDYDLSQHQKTSGKDMQYTDPMTGRRYLPHCVEPSRGLTRAILTVMIDAYDEEEYTNQKGEKEIRTVARFNPNIAPVKFAILPLIKKDEIQVKLGEDLFHKLSKKYFCEYDDNGAIGKRYRRQDEIGTPYCITFDQQSVEEYHADPASVTVTLRDRDTMSQQRFLVSDIEFMK
ncbi:glycine--tRNA ligase [candidate division SR1 bacterium]|nr:glycine--tRNA ligase [candidate division SR1 bacterium]